MTHTKLSCDSISIPLLEQLQSAWWPLQLFDVAAVCMEATPQKSLKGKASNFNTSDPVIQELTITRRILFSKFIGIHRYQILVSMPLTVL